jgi:hypothetical protein
MIDRHTVKTIHGEPVPEIVQLFHLFAAVTTLDDFLQLLGDMEQGVLLPQRHERPRPPTVFGWAGAFARDTDGIAVIGLWSKEGFDTELVLPVVPQVIVIEETFT